MLKIADKYYEINRKQKEPVSRKTVQNRFFKSKTPGLDGPPY